MSAQICEGGDKALTFQSMSSSAANFPGIFFTISSFTSATTQLSSVLTTPDVMDRPRTQKKSLRERVGFEADIIYRRKGHFELRLPRRMEIPWRYSSDSLGVVYYADMLEDIIRWFKESPAPSVLVPTKLPDHHALNQSFSTLAEQNGYILEGLLDWTPCQAVGRPGPFSRPQRGLAITWSGVSILVYRPHVTRPTGGL